MQPDLALAIEIAIDAFWEVFGKFGRELRHFEPLTFLTRPLRET
jgi:hypothetical protein